MSPTKALSFQISTERYPGLPGSLKIVLVHYPNFFQCRTEPYNIFGTQNGYSELTGSKLISEQKLAPQKPIRVRALTNHFSNSTEGTFDSSARKEP